MRKLNATQIVIALAMLVNVAWIIDEWPQPKQAANRHVETVNINKAELIKRYPDYPFDFTIDFNYDNIPDRLFIEQRNANSPYELVVQNNDARDLMRLPCAKDGDIIRTSAIVYKFEAQTRLLVSRNGDLTSEVLHVFSWNLEQKRMSEIKPLSSDERSALSEMMTLINQGDQTVDDIYVETRRNDLLWIRRVFYALSLVALCWIYRHLNSTLRSSSHVHAQP